MSLANIKKIIVVIMENRSFDHVAGYLSLPSADPPMAVAGLSDDEEWKSKYANDDEDGTPRKVYPLAANVQRIPDPPHEKKHIKRQINTPTHADATDKMGGFVKSYGDAKPKPADRKPVMGYYGKDAVPVFDFFARNFAICDHWFSALPTGTQANRLMAMSGESKIDDNVSNIFKFPNQDLIYDWIKSNMGDNRWCAYQWEGFPFFFLMPKWRNTIAASLGDPFNVGPFRKYNVLGNGFKAQWAAGGDVVPDIIFIEPKYTDDPTFSAANDDHPPTGILAGQKFLADIYNTIVSNDELWKSTMMIVTYDEHGGFFDHMPPLDISTTAGPTAFTTSGPRVPAFVISPYVKPGSVFSDALDHTSILQLLADRFTPGKAYSDKVKARQDHLVPLKTILEPAPVPTAPRPIPDDLFDSFEEIAVADAGVEASKTATAEAFHGAIMALAEEHPELLAQPHWTNVAAYVAAASDTLNT